MANVDTLTTNVANWTALPQDLLVEVGRFGVSWEMREVCSAWRKSTRVGFFTRPGAESRSGSRKCIKAPGSFVLLSFLPPEKLRYYSNDASHFRTSMIARIVRMSMIEFSPQFNDLVELEISHLKGRLPYMPKLNKLKLYESNVGFGQLPKLEILKLKWCDNIDVIPNSAGLRELYLFSCEIALPRDMPKLEKLRIEYCPVTALPESCYELRELVLEVCEVSSLSMHAPRLEKLVVCSCDRVRELPPRSEKLRELSLELCGVRNLSLERYPNLRALTLRYCSDLQLPAVLPRLPKLERLCLVNQAHVKKMHLKDLKSCLLLNCESIEKVSTASVVELGVFHLPKLSDLQVNGAANAKINMKNCESLAEARIAAESLQLNVENMPSLAVLTLVGSSHKAEIRNCESLVELNLPPRISKLYAESLPKLTAVACARAYELKVWNCDSLRALSRIESVSTLDLRGLPSLVELSANGGARLGGARLKLMRCGALESLSLSSMSDVHISGLPMMVSLSVTESPRMESFKIAHCDSLATLSLSSSVSTLHVERLHKLTNLAVTGDGSTVQLGKCRSLASASLPSGVSHLVVRRLPQLTCLAVAGAQSGAYVRIVRCSRLETVSLSSVASVGAFRLRKLKSLEVKNSSSRPFELVIEQCPDVVVSH